MSHEDVLTEIGSHFSSALKVFFDINSDTNDELASYGTPESRAAGLLEKLRKAQGMLDMLSSLAMPRSVSVYSGYRHDWWDSLMIRRCSSGVIGGLPSRTDSERNVKAVCCCNIT
jgi:hypothetical protein